MISIEGLGKIDALIFELLYFLKKVPILNQVSTITNTESNLDWKLDWDSLATKHF